MNSITVFMYFMYIYEIHTKSHSSDSLKSVDESQLKERSIGKFIP